MLHLCNMQKVLLNIALAFLIGISICSCKGDKTTDSLPNTTGDEFIDELNRQIAADDDNPDLLYQRSKAFLEREAFDRAIIDMEEAMKIDSLKPEYYHHLSNVFMDYYKSRRALQTMLVAKKLFPERIETLLKLSETQYILKMYDASISTINHIFFLKKENPEAFFMLGLNLQAQGDLPRATLALKQAVDRDPELIDAWLLLGNIAERQNDPEAATYYDSAIRIAPNNLSTIHSKAYYLQNHGEEDEAINLYRNIVGKDREYVDAYLNMGILYLEKDSLDLAYEQFNIISKLQPTNPVAQYYKGVVNKLKGDFATARGNFKSTLALDPTFVRAKEALDEMKEVN